MEVAAGMCRYMFVDSTIDFLTSMTDVGICIICFSFPFSICYWYISQLEGNTINYD